MLILVKCVSDLGMKIPDSGFVLKYVFYLSFAQTDTKIYLEKRMGGVTF